MRQPSSRARNLAVLALVAVGLSATLAIVPPRPASAQGSPAATPVKFSLGDIFAGIGDGKFNHFDSAGNLLATLDDGQSAPGENATTGMCFGPDGTMYATNVRANSMSVFTSAGTLLSETWGTFDAQPESCLILDGTTMYTSEVQGTGDILKLDLSGNKLASYDVRRSDWIDLAADRCTMYYTDEGAAIHRFDVCANTALPDFASGSGGKFALRVLPDGSVLVASTQSVKRFDSSGSEMATYTVPDEGWFFALNLDPDGTHFWTGGLRTGRVYKFAIDPVGPPVATFAALVRESGGTELAGLAIYGEVIASQPSPAPTATAPTPPPTPIPTASAVGPGPSPGSDAGTLGPVLLVLLLLGLMAVALLLWRRRGRHAERP